MSTMDTVALRFGIVDVTIEGLPPFKGTGGTFESGQDGHWVEGSVRDEDWAFQDAQGHWHAWTEHRTITGAFRRTEFVGGCGDGCCDGFTETWWECSTCFERIQPGYRPETKWVCTDRWSNFDFVAVGPDLPVGVLMGLESGRPMTVVTGDGTLHGVFRGQTGSTAITVRGGGQERVAEIPLRMHVDAIVVPA
jgi:hypothetical protein